MAFFAGSEFLVELMERKVVEGLHTVLICALPGFFTTGPLILIIAFWTLVTPFLVNGSALLRMGQQYLPAAYSHLSSLLAFQPAPL